MIIRGTQQAAGDVAPETEQAAAGMPHALEIQAAEEFGDDVTAGRLPSIRVIRARLHVGQPHAQLVCAYLGTLVAGLNTATERLCVGPALAPHGSIREMASKATCALQPYGIVPVQGL